MQLAISSPHYFSRCISVSLDIHCQVMQVKPASIQVFNSFHKDLHAKTYAVGNSAFKANWKAVELWKYKFGSKPSYYEHTLTQKNLAKPNEKHVTKKTPSYVLANDLLVKQKERVPHMENAPHMFLIPDDEIMFGMWLWPRAQRACARRWPGFRKQTEAIG